jgi:hypothetical protein
MTAARGWDMYQPLVFSSLDLWGFRTRSSAMIKMYSLILKLGAAMADFFTLNPRYERYELGVYPLEYQTVYGAKRWRLGGTAFRTLLVILLIASIVKLESMKKVRPLFTPELADQIILIISAGAVLLAGGAEVENFFHTLKSNKRYQNLVSNGILIDGQITRIQVQEAKAYVRDKYPPFQLRELRDTYYIRVVYTFVSPDQQVISGEQTRARNDLRDKPLPPVRTPIRVLYADDNTHVML